METVGAVRSHLSKFRVECHDAADKNAWGMLALFLHFLLIWRDSCYLSYKYIWERKQNLCMKEPKENSYSVLWNYSMYNNQIPKINGSNMNANMESLRLEISNCTTNIRLICQQLPSRWKIDVSNAMFTAKLKVPFDTLLKYL